jgi:hypothetical protein
MVDARPLTILSKRPPSTISSSPTILPYYQKKEGDIHYLTAHTQQNKKHYQKKISNNKKEP